MSSENFYRDLPATTNFCQIITHGDCFISIPHDWHILITDAISSTKAIELGRYKDMNIIGACSIIAILNLTEKRKIPFIFGGDGASIIIPSSLLSKARKSLLATQKLAKEEFNLDLRVGSIPISSVTEAGFDVRIAKVRFSEKYEQAMFSGGGLSYADALLKDPDNGDRYLFQQKEGETDIGADFSGLICPWRDIKSCEGKIVSLLVKATANTPEENDRVYYNLAEYNQRIFSDRFQPIAAENLSLAFEGDNLDSVAKVKAKSKNWFVRQFQMLRLKVTHLLLAILIHLNVKIGTNNFANAKQDVVSDADYRKFDDTLRMIISANPEQIESLKTYLTQQYKQGNLVYGLHISDRALMTCLVASGEGYHVGFMDGSDGGYALAAQGMKKQLKNLRFRVDNRSNH
ncbi:MAG: DUF3095 domain-containing protein [Cyanobacteria bacterium P01_E01_bin.42]